MARKPLLLGAAYHGNRMPSHAREDMRDMVRCGCDLVVHMFSHTDWDRHMRRMKDIVEISQEAGLEVWADNWGLSGPPGDKSHFLAYHPEAHMVYSDGQVDPVRACLNSAALRSFVSEWIDAVEYLGVKTIFWDEPHLPKDGARYSCACPACRERFRARYGREMPETADEDVERFRTDTIVEYFREITAYSAKKGMKNTVCVMLGEQHGIGLSTLDRICALDTLDNIGSDPYWLHVKDCSPYAFVYENARRNIEISERFGKDHNIWIQAYSTPRGREEEIIQATEAAYDAGARTILAWGYAGSESNDYAAANPEKTWQITAEAFRRVREIERNDILEENRRLYRK